VLAGQAASVAPTVLIVDEGQQLTTREAIGTLDELLTGGIESGQWRWFADPNRQVTMGSNYEPEAGELLRLLSTSQLLLYDNCRNTEETIEHAEFVSGGRIGRPLLKGHGPRVKYSRGNSDGAAIREAAEQIAAWTSRSVEPSSIVILHPDADTRPMATAIAAAAGLKVKYWTDVFDARSRGDSFVTIATIAEFRGLEADCVILCGLESILDRAELDALLYIGLTRATFAAFVCATRKAKDRIVPPVKGLEMRTILPGEGE
jgi:superfamily I DNA/RNA helicase